MFINLKTCALNRSSGPVTLTLNDRLPTHIEAPCTLNCDFQLEAVDDYHLLHLAVTGDITIICQRCLQPFASSYSNQSSMALCRDDAQAERLLPQYESVVIENNQVNLIDLLSDEMFLYSPQMHENTEGCDDSINQYIRINNETSL